MIRPLFLGLLASALLKAESFESFPAGPLSSLATDVGTWSAEAGHAALHQGNGKSGSRSLRLLGGAGRELILTLPSPLEKGVGLSFHAERWTARSPFLFRIDEMRGEQWVEIRNADAEVKVGGFHAEIRLQPSTGVRKFRFRGDTHADGGVLIDDVSVQRPGPLRVVNVETTQPVCPAFIREDHNPVLGFKVTVEGSEGELKLENLDLGFEGSSRMSDIEFFRVVRGDAQPSAEPGMSVASSDRVSARQQVPANCTLSSGTHWFWISPVLRSGASLDGRIDASLFSVRISGKTFKPSDPSPAGAQRIGFAIRLPGDDSSKSYRIPGLVRSKAGTLIAAYDIRYRHSGDLPADIDVGISRSTDGGASWLPMQVAMDMGNDPKASYDGVGDPAILADPRTGRIWIVALWSHGKRAWFGSGPGMTPEETGQLMISHSDDDGLTWSRPRNLTPMVKDPAWRLFFNGPGAGIALRDGTLVFAAQYRAADGKPWSTLIASKDGGETWTTGTGVKSDTTEAQVAELDDGSIMINCRDNRGGSRTVAVTRDLGRTWSLHATDRKALREPVCMGSLLAWRHPRRGSLLWFSNPDATDGRHSMTIKLSTDQGQTWPERRHLLYDSRKCFGYSCLAPVDDNRIGVIYEGVDTMYFLRIPLSEWPQ